MRKLIALILLLSAVLLSGCALYTAEDLQEAYDRGNDAGYIYGYNEGLYKGIERFEDDYMTVRDIHDEASGRARRITDLTPEEASYIVSDYLYDTNIYSSNTSTEEFYQAVETLYEFYQYFN